MSHGRINSANYEFNRANKEDSSVDNTPHNFFITAAGIYT